MKAYQGIAKGTTIELEQALPYRDGERLTVSVEAVRDMIPGAPAAVLQAVGEPPHLEDDEVNELERQLEDAQLPVRSNGAFDGNV
jgi:hypothetical protein